jgi:anti-sigma-K factor RskA
MNTRGHEEQVENVGAYALGALPELEAQVFERHLMGCTACQDELQRMHQAADALPRSVTPYRPPDSLKESLMATVHEEAARARPVAEQRPRRRWSWRPQLRPAMAMAAAALVIAIAVYGLARDPGTDEGRTVAAQVDARFAPKGTASLSIPAGEEGAVLNVRGLPDPGRGRVYEVWVQRGDDIVPVSIFSVDDTGVGAAAVPGSLEDATVVMVTRERRGGASAPTEMPLVSARI